MEDDLEEEWMAPMTKLNVVALVDARRKINSGAS